jgi:hypothetical protein
MIKVKMDIQQACDIVLAFCDELKPGTGRPNPDHIRRALIQAAIDMVRARANEALDQLIDEALPQARSDFPHLSR